MSTAGIDRLEHQLKQAFISDLTTGVDGIDFGAWYDATGILAIIESMASNALSGA